MCMYVFVGWSYNRAESERENNNKSTEGREREKEKITHVLAIKDGLGLEEEEDEGEESHIADCCCCCCCYDLFPCLLFLLSVDGSVYFTFVKNKENINMTRRRRKDRSSFCTHTYSIQGYVCLQRVMIVVVSFFFLLFLILFRLQRNECADAEDIFFSLLFLSDRSFVCSFVRSRPKGEEKKKEKYGLSHSSL
jgi:hypothetical protein